jgi:predicted AlkP superfamily phosphohydrolase/phosphomutase
MMAWSTFATGNTPGNHGIYNFILKEINSNKTKFADLDTLRQNSTPFWEYLNAVGVGSGIINIMPGYPPSKSSGYHITDHITTPARGPFAYPASATDILDSIDGEFQFAPITGYSPGDGEEALASYIDRFFEIERNRIQMTKELIANHDTPASAIVFSGPDVFLHEIGHLLDEEHPKHEPKLAQKYADSIYDLLHLYDGFLSWLQEYMSSDDYLIVLSDHGHDSVHTAVNLNSWLYQNDYLSLKTRPQTLLKKFVYNYVYGGARKAMKQLNVYDQLKLIVARSGGGNSNFDLANLLTISQNDIDWEQTDAYTIAGDGQIYINHDRGSQAYAEIKSELLSDLQHIRDPERDAAVVDSVIDGEAAYGGTMVETRPDLVCTPVDGYRFSFPQTMQTDSYLHPPQKWWSHTSESDRDGIFYLSGPDVSSTNTAQVGLAAFAPTLFYLLDVPIPDSMDGVPQTDLVDNDAGPERDTYDTRLHVTNTVRRIASELQT